MLAVINWGIGSIPGAVDQDGEVVDLFLQARRERAS